MSLLWGLGTLTVVLTMTASSLSLVLLHEVSHAKNLAGFATYVGFTFAISLLTIPAVVHMCVYLSHKAINSMLDYSLGRRVWPHASITTVASILEGIALIWLSIRWSELQNSQIATLRSWQITWTFLILARIGLLTTVHLHIKKSKRGSGLRERALTIARERSPNPQNMTQVSDSRAATLTPRPASSQGRASCLSSTTKIGSSIRSKFIKSSPHSSLDLPRPPRYDLAPADSAFDRYDVSHMEVESLPINKVGSHGFISDLETIPSPGIQNCPEMVMVPELPATPRSRTSRYKSTATPVASPTAALKDRESPPNFSRPTSKGQNRISLNAEPYVGQPKLRAGSSTERRPAGSISELIHPLFRPDSPDQPQILSSGTMVTASPLANQPITPKTLAKLRSESDLRHRTALRSRALRATSTSSTSAASWRTTPLVEPIEIVAARARSKSNPALPGAKPESRSSNESPTTPRTPLAVESSFYTQKDDEHWEKRDATELVGHVQRASRDDADLPLPSYVANAGSRTSLVAFEKRKSVKRKNSHGRI